MTVAVVGHVEWTEFAPVERVPRPGEIVESAHAWQQPAGGGAVAAVQIAKLTGSCRFFTALGDDELGRRAARELEELGLDLEVAWRPEPQRRAFVFLDANGERTITVIGPRPVPRGTDGLPWEELAGAAAVYVTGGDEEALRRARQAGNLVATVRAGPALSRSGVPLDALVLSGGDAGERYLDGDIEPPPRAVIRTSGAEGGTIAQATGETSWAAAPLPGPWVDAHGAGDSFAGGLTAGLDQGLSIEDAVGLAARCGAACATGRGPYERQLTAWT
jgi:ribokinase